MSQDPTTIANSQDLQQPIYTLNLSNITKLTTTNYLTWSLQVKFLLEGYELQHHIDKSHAPPPKVTTGTTTPNPEYVLWKRQDALIFSALIGSISPTIQPLVARATTTLSAWTTLADTYSKPSRGHIKQLKQQLKRVAKGSKTISDYMQGIKTITDTLKLLGKPIDNEDVIDVVLDGLSDGYQSIIDTLVLGKLPYHLMSCMKSSSTRKLLFSPRNLPSLAS